MFKMDRPAFLAARPHDENGAGLIEAFRETSFANRLEADKWLSWALAYGSTTWQEDHLWAAIENEEVEL